ncbi:unnamed protein product [Rotaria socialis]|uniref:Uncharacterized protein n=1 Tax=Rotaria socialis TaxID=392032 RepID=A0A818EVU5_9BILA|nr:unnamed protein product [Rotaria socialis]CAF3464301.1 unnamed protein product [Rotaria socialis]CAF3472552.1 unnamed protein product [Rotaria socialis]CAF3509377.1 unnamed protein product [Rotaria socialis]CAF3564817.1 unnamed protein product [Rotaria socialis]
MDNQYYPGNQSYRSTQSQGTSEGLYTPMTSSRPIVTHYTYPQQSETSRTIHANGEYSNNQRIKYWWEPSGPFKPYRTTYQDYGPGTNLSYRRPKNYLTQPYIYHDPHGVLRPPVTDTDPNKYAYEVPHKLDASPYASVNASPRRTY